jgi:hypothetical protein
MSKNTKRNSKIMANSLIATFTIFFLSLFIPFLFLLLPITFITLVIGFVLAVIDQTKLENKLDKVGHVIQNQTLKCNNCKLEQEVRVSIIKENKTIMRRVLEN